MPEVRDDRARPVPELDRHVQHLRDEVAVGKPSASNRPAPLGTDPDRDAPDERLESHRGLDRPRERRRGAAGNGDTEVLMEDAPQLDAGLEEERLAAR
jgi:hypothetical protein